MEVKFPGLGDLDDIRSALTKYKNDEVNYPELFTEMQRILKANDSADIRNLLAGYGFAPSD